MGMSPPVRFFMETAPWQNDSGRGGFSLWAQKPLNMSPLRVRGSFEGVLSAVVGLEWSQLPLAPLRCPKPFKPYSPKHQAQNLYTNGRQHLGLRFRMDLNVHGVSASWVWICRVSCIFNFMTQCARLRPQAALRMLKRPQAVASAFPRSGG